MALCINAVSGSLAIAGDSVLVDGVYTCPFTDSYVLLNTGELANYRGSYGWTAADGLSIGWDIGLVWLVVFGITYLARTVSDMVRESANES